MPYPLSPRNSLAVITSGRIRTACHSERSEESKLLIVKRKEMLRFRSAWQLQRFFSSLLKIFDQAADTSERLQALDSPDSTSQTSSSNSDAHNKIYLNQGGLRSEEV